MLHRAFEAWRSEFWPPIAAESALTLVSTLARKCAWLSMGLARRQFAIAVPGVWFTCLIARQCHLFGCIWSPSLLGKLG